MIHKQKNMVKINYWRFSLVYVILAASLFLQSCEKAGVMKDPYIDPHIIFSSYRWWNYDIFIADIYGGHILPISPEINGLILILLFHLMVQSWHLFH